MEIHRFPQVATIQTVNGPRNYHQIILHRCHRPRLDCPGPKGLWATIEIPVTNLFLPQPNPWPGKIITHFYAVEP